MQESYIEWLRKRVGRRKIFLVFGTVVLRDENGRILTIQRRDNKVWALPAGFSNLGENVAQTAVRETLEETGYQIELERLIGVYSGPKFQHIYENGDKVQNVGAIFKARVVDGQPKPDLAEVAELRWQTPERFLAGMFSASWRGYFRLVLQHLDDGSFVC